MDRRALGAKGEDVAAGYLEGLGYRIVERNFRCPLGEIDVVAQTGGTVVFCEVKTRRSARWGEPSEAVNPSKQARIRRLGAVWLAERAVRARDVRFDVVSITWHDQGPSVAHLIGAF